MPEGLARTHAALATTLLFFQVFADADELLARARHRHALKREERQRFVMRMARQRRLVPVDRRDGRELPRRAALATAAQHLPALPVELQRRLFAADRAGIDPA